MRRIIAFENITLDGYFAGPNGEIDWAEKEPKVMEQAQKSHSDIDLFMFGRITYDMMVSFWPTPAAQEANPTFADILNNTEKLVFSKSLHSSDWEHTTIQSDLTKKVIMDLKKQDGKDIMIFGSGTLIMQLTNLKLIDQYQLVLNPIVLGDGKPLFSHYKGKGITDDVRFTLTDSHVFDSGIVLLNYETV